MYFFCSQTLPSYIAYDEEKQRFSVVIPFGNDGEPWGISGGAAHLYNYVCNGGRHLTYNISPRDAEADIFLNHQTEIMEYRR